MKHRFNRLPLRFSLPLLLLLAFMLSSIASLLFSMNVAKQELIEQAKQHAMSDSHYFSSLAENELNIHPVELQRNLKRHAAVLDEFNALSAAVIDPQGKVLYAMRSDWEGQSASSVIPGWDERRRVRVATQVAVDIRLDEKNDVLDSLESFHFKLRDSSFDTQHGLIYMSFDLRRALDRSKTIELREHIPHLTLALLASLFLAWWLRRHLTLPINKFSGFAQKVGAGNLDLTLQGDFPGDLQAFADHLNQMTRQLRNDREVLIQEQELTQRYLDTVNAVVVVLDSKGDVKMLNRKGLSLLGYTAEELYGCNWFATVLPQPNGMQDVYPVFLRIMAGDLKGAESFENDVLDKSGQRHLVRWSNAYFRDSLGNITGTISSGEDITTSHQEALTMRRLSQVVEQSPEYIIITDLQGNISYTNNAFLLNSGYSSEEVLGKNPRFLQSGKTPRATYQSFWQALTRGEVWQGEFINRRKDGSEYAVELVASVVCDAAGQAINYMAIEQNINLRKQTEQAMAVLAYTDGLTQLGNRERLLDRMRVTLPFALRQKRVDALLVLNIDRFKLINEARGQELGDLLLQAVAKRLGEHLREGDLAVRMAGDEFALLLPDVALRSDDAAMRVLRIAEELQQRLHSPFELGNEHLSITISMGIALLPLDADDKPLTVIRRANAALHQAKSRGAANIAFFESSMTERAKQNFLVEGELRRGIRDNELRVFLQPQANRDGRIVAAEALVRWQHPQRGLLSPFSFIPVAEETELIVELGDWMLKQVCQMLVDERLQGVPFRIAVNVSPRQFRKAGFAAGVLDHLKRSGADASHLTLEITEGLMLHDVGQVIATMSALAAKGIHFSIDDFGTGYSSLAYLKRLPINELKIDKSFVQDAPSNPDDAALVDAILSLAHHLHLNVVAEGVETQAQADFLNARGTLLHQGYFFGKPMPAEQLLAKIRMQVA